MNDAEGAALLAAINEMLNDLAPRLIYSDWLKEKGRTNEALAWRGQLAKSPPLGDFYSGGHGDGDGFADRSELNGRGYSGCGLGYGYGEGDGHGYGSGYMVAANGGTTGYGSEDGSGEGHSYERGDKDGLGTGEGFQNGNPYRRRLHFLQTVWVERFKLLLERKPVVGKQMLIWCGRGFAWIGRVDEIYAPGCYKLSNAGMLCRTGPDSWMAVASGAAPDNYVYRHAPDGIVYTGPELHGAVEWKGELPGRDMR